MWNDWDYIEARLADQRATADRRRRVAQARTRNRSTSRLAGLWRSRPGRNDEMGGCRQ
jgi:hypothetical protein